MNKCEECSKNTITTDKGVMEVNNAVVEKAMEDGNMPVISMFYGIIVSLYFLDNRRHMKPHIRAKY
jgi:hypothetical protein